MGGEGEILVNDYSPIHNIFQKRQRKYWKNLISVFWFYGKTNFEWGSIL